MHLSFKTLNALDNEFYSNSMVENPDRQLIPSPLSVPKTTRPGARRIISTAVSDAQKVAKKRNFININGINFSINSIKQLELWSRTIIIKGQKYINIKLLVDFISGQYKELKNSNWEEAIIDGEITEVIFLDGTNWFDNKLDLTYSASLKHLYCVNNSLSELNLLSATALKRLFCSENVLTKLDLSNTPALTNLWCHNNLLNELDLSCVPALTTLNCDNNQLTSLDLSHNRALTTLHCLENRIEELNLSHTPDLDNLDWGIRQDYLVDAVFGYGRGELANEAIERGLTFARSHKEYSTLKDLITLKLSTLTPREERVIRMRYGIGLPSFHSLEQVAKEFSISRSRVRQIESKALRKLKHPSRSRRLREFLFHRVVISTYPSKLFLTSFGYNERFTEVGGLSFSKNSVKQLEIWAASIIIEGKAQIEIEELVELIAEKSFWKFGMGGLENGEIYTVNFPGDEKISWLGDRLDLSTLPHLEGLSCSEMKLKELDISLTPNLTNLHCHNNRLTDLDLTHTHKLTYLVCHNNQLTDLDLSHNTALTELFCSHNQLAEIDLSHSPVLKNLWCKGNHLTELDLSLTPNLTSLHCSNNQLAELNLSHSPVLKDLWCDDNQLTAVDLSHNPSLEELDCSNNSLAELDLSHTPVLKNLWCDDNRLTDLDLSPIPDLIVLSCDKNQLTRLDIKHAPNLVYLYCDNNRLNRLDLELAQTLKELSCTRNELVDLDLSRLPVIETVWCMANPIQELDIRNNPELSYLDVIQGFVRIIKNDWQFPDA